MEIAENTATNTKVGDPIEASDPESDVLVYSVSGADSDFFDIDDSTGQISIGADTALDHEYPVDADGDNVYVVTLQVTDGRDGDGNADTAVDDTVSVAITVIDVNERPEFGPPVVELEIAENTATNTSIGDQIAATDPESDTLTYSLVGADSQWFDVDTSSGQIKTEGLLDHESPSDVGGRQRLRGYAASH